MLSDHTILIAALLAALSVGLAALGLASNPQATTATLAGPFYPSLADSLNNIDKITVTADGNTFAVERRGDGAWTLPAKDGYPAATDPVAAALVGMASLRRVEAKTGLPERYGRLQVGPPGPEQPSIQLTLSRRDETVADLILGKPRTGGLGRNQPAQYVRDQGQATAWLVAGQVEVDRDPIRWLNREVANLSRDTIARISITGTDREPLQIVRVGDGGEDFTVQDVPDDATLAEDWKIANVASTLQFTNFDDVRLDDGSAAAVANTQFATTTGLLISADVLSVNDERLWVRLAAVAAAADTALTDEAQAQLNNLNARWTGWLYKLPKFKIDRLTTTLEDLLVEPTAE
jgi:hypothetical protein